MVFIVTVEFTERVLGLFSCVVFLGWIFARLGWIKKFHVVSVEFTERVLGPASGVIILGWMLARIGWIKRFHVWAALKCYGHTA